MGVRQGAWEPRAHLIEPRRFGRDGSARWRAPRNITDAGQLAASRAQHHAAALVRTHLTAGRVTVAGLAEKVGVSAGFLSGQLTGRYIAHLDDLARWAITLDDPTIVTLTPPERRHRSW